MHGIVVVTTILTGFCRARAPQNEVNFLKSPIVFVHNFGAGDAMLLIVAEKSISCHVSRNGNHLELVLAWFHVNVKGLYVLEAFESKKIDTLAEN